jgi:polyisoprenoid-binding protein YceI
MRKTFLAALAAAALVAGFAGAAAADESDAKLYWFGTHLRHNNITFTSEADVENIYGVTHTLRGTTWIDWKTMKGKCSIAVPVKSMRTGIDLRDEHLRSDIWLDEAKYPDIRLVSDDITVTVRNKDKGLYDAKVAGDLTIHGVTRRVETAARVIQVMDEKSKQMIGDGEWVRVIATFDVRLSDYRIVIPEGPVQGKVNPVWSVKFDCYASTVKDQ